MASAVQFLERWRCLSDPKTTDNERAGNYTVLTSYLKEGNLNPSFSKELCQHQQPLLHRILRDVTCKSCDHAALQVLGYCLHNVEFASKFNKEQVNSTIKGLQEVIKSGDTEKSVCTRALWCLTNQQLPVDHVTSHVTSIITMAAEVVTVNQVGVATVSSEALNLLIRFGQQFPAPFVKLTSTWYKAIVELLICKVNKVQHKALNVAVNYETQVQGSHETTHWLTKTLKERVVGVMLAQLTERGHDHVHVLRSWAHFVTVLGKTLHKHGSFLNELLRVVETGFKHRSPQVQVAAYDAWKTLITNFALDLNVMTSSKRLKLLMMPLLASAVRERHDTVEQARIQTWWHLIGRLGNRRPLQFQQVCVPFLLLCLGMDPKSDISQLPDSICDLQSHSHSTASDSKSSTDPSNAQTPKSSSTITLAVTPTPAASSSGAPPTSATPTSSHTHGRLLSAINTPKSRSGVEIEKGKKTSDRYQTPPTVAMVMTGCHALFEFTGGRDEFPHSLIKSDPGVCMVFPKLVVPMETAHFMLLFLDALLTYAIQLEFKQKGINLDLVLHHIVTVLTSSIEAEDGVSSTTPTTAALLVAPLVDLLHSGGLTEFLGRQMRMDVHSQLSSLSPRLLLTAGGGRRAPSDSWKKLVSELLGASKQEQTSDWFSRNWLKLTRMIPSTSIPLSNMLFLSNELSRLIKEDGMEREIGSTLWTSLANELTSFIAKTSQINSGTALEPNFDPLRQILKFPFLHLLDHGERSHVTSVMDVWKNLYETANIHMGLVVTETNLCAELVCSDLYAAYGQYMKQVPSSLDQKHQVLRFDLYQNAIASALSYVVSKIKWGTLVAPAMGGQPSKERGSGRVKSLETLLSLLAWQLAAFWDTTKKGPMQLSQLTTPYTLLDIVESLYHHVTSSALITMATEMIGQPLATLFEAILKNSSSQPSTGRSRMTQQDIEHHVEKVWKSITICFQSRHTHPFDSALLSTLSPLLVATLNSSNRQLSNLAMSFWAVTFDKAQKLDYPARLRDYFVKYLRDLKQPSELKLPGLSGTALTLTNAQKELIVTEDSCQLGQSEVIQFSDTQSHSQSRNQDSDIRMVDVVLPNPSPQKKGVCGSFLNRSPVAGSPLKPRPGPSSPHAKQLDEILARSATTMEKVQSSPLKGVGVADRKGAGSPLASARRRLDLGNDKEEYVSVGPPAVKKRRVLTEHQVEVMRERRTDLPTLYNALDPTLDSAPITMATLDQSTQQFNEEDPIVISESEDILPPTCGPTSVPDSIPIPHSRPPVSPTSRDAPITIPDSPPLTPPTSSQPSITMATTAPSTASNITAKTSVNPSSAVQASVNSLPVVTSQPSTVVTTMSIDKMLEINQSLINATARLCAQTTLAITGKSTMPSQLPTPQPPSLKSITEQKASQPSTLSTPTSQSDAAQSVAVSGAQTKSMSAVMVTSAAQSVSIAQTKSVPATSDVHSMSVPQATPATLCTSIQASGSTAALCTVQSQSAVSSTSVHVRVGQLGSISTPASVLVQSGSVSTLKSLPHPPSTTSTVTAASNTGVIKSSASCVIPIPANVLQPASLGSPKMQTSGSLQSAESAVSSTQSNGGVSTSSVGVQSSGIMMTSSILKQNGAISTRTLPPVTQTAASASTCTPTHVLFRDPVSVASSFDIPYTSSPSLPYAFSAPIIISQLGQRGVPPPVQGQSVPLPPTVRVPGVPLTGRGMFGQVISTLPGQIMSTGVGIGGHRMATGPSILAQVVQPKFGISVRGAVDQMGHPIIAPPPPPVPRVIRGTAPQPPLRLPPPHPHPPAPPGTARISPGIPPGSAKQGRPPPFPPPLQPGVIVTAQAALSLPSTSGRQPQLATRDANFQTTQMVSQGVQIVIPPRVDISQNDNIPAPITRDDSAGIKNGEPVVVTSQDAGRQRNLPASSEALGLKTSLLTTAAQEVGAKKKTVIAVEGEKAKAPEVRKRGRPRKVSRQEEVGGAEGGVRDESGVAAATRRGRGRSRKQSYDLIYEECAPSNQGGNGKEEKETRRSTRKRKLKSADGTILAATVSTNEITAPRSDTPGRRMTDVAIQSERPASKKSTTEVCASNQPSLSATDSIPTKPAAPTVSSNKDANTCTYTTSHSVTTNAVSGSASQVVISNKNGEKSIAKGSTSSEKSVESDGANNEPETEQSAPQQVDDDNMDTQTQNEEDTMPNNDRHISEDSEDPLCGLKSKRKRETEGEGGEVEKRTEKRMRIEEPKEGGDEDKGQPASPELITPETEVDRGEQGEVMSSKTCDSSNMSESKKDQSNSLFTGTELLESDSAQISDSKLAISASEIQSTEHSKPISSDNTAKNDDKIVTTTSTRESSGGRKCLSLRRHSTGPTSTPSNSSSGEASVSGEGGERERGEVHVVGGGEREETAAGGSSRKPLSSLVDTPTNGKGGILKHTSQFDSPSTAKAGRRVQFATIPVFHEPQTQQVKQEETEPAKPVTPKQSRVSRTSSGSFSSRRTLMMSQTPPKMILVNKPHPPTTCTPPQSSGPVYPSLKDCQSPVEQILPALSPSSKFTHGLLQLVSAQNITTVGNISSLSEHEVQTLPIKSPKVQTLRSALRSFEHQLQGSKRKSSIDSETSLVTPPPRKQPRLDSDLLSSSTCTSSSSSSTITTATSSKDGGATKQEKNTKMASSQREEGTGSRVTTDGSLKENVILGDKSLESQEAQDERSLECKTVQSLEGKEAGSQEDTVVYMYVLGDKEVSGQEKSEDIQPQEATETRSQEAKEEFESQEAMEHGCPHGEQEPAVKNRHEEVKTSYEERERESQEAESEELSEGSCDINTAMITLCTPESQLTPPDPDTNDTTDQREQDTDTCASEKKVTDGERMDRGDDHLATAHLESPPLTPPTAGPELRPQASSVSHDHPYCSPKLKPDKNDSLEPSVTPLNREGKINKIGSVHVVVLDHAYCSQQEGESADSADIKANVSDTDSNIGSKLSLTVHDHTYCSNSWTQPEGERKAESNLMETAPEYHQEAPELQQEEDSRALALSSVKGNSREERDGKTGPTAMDEEGGTVTGDNERSDTISREERGMETGSIVVHEAAPVIMDLNMSSGDDNSDVFTDGEDAESESISSSSQSQELFSQEPSQEKQQILIPVAALERGSGGGTSSSNGAESSSVLLPNTREEECIGDQGGACNVDESADVTVAGGDGNEGETDRARGGIETQELETREVMEGSGGQSAVSVAPDVKGQVQPTSAGSGSADSSDSSSSTHTYNAECSQRPSSLPSDSAHDHTSNQPGSSHSPDETSLFATMAQIRDLHEKFNEQLEERDSLSQKGFTGCLQILDAVAQTTRGISKLFTRNTRSQSSSQDVDRAS